MKKIEFAKLSWPVGLNLDLIQNLLTEDELKELIIDHCRENRIQRRCVLPSLKCLKKVVFHHLCVKHKEDYKAVMLELRGEFRTLKMLDVSRQKVRQLYKQRCKEIAKERN